ncbi:hypothetical protein [Mycetocola sp. 2940]|uniref:hypothetical protein n=1 Tax=Mycetocola sp. 2940 TaxID=3156452 RepID=UPI003392DFF6
MSVTTAPPDGAAIGTPESSCNSTVIGPRLATSDACPDTAGVRKTSFVATGLVTVTDPLEMRLAVQERNPAVTVYVYVPSGTLTSVQDAVVSNTVRLEPHAAVVTPPVVRVTKYPEGVGDPADGVQLTSTSPELAMGTVTLAGARSVPVAALVLAVPADFQ